MLNIEQKKGDHKKLSGKLIAYAYVDTQDEGAKNSPLQGMVQNGILAVSGNYLEQSSLQDFLRKEFGTSMEEGLGGFIEHLQGMGDELPEGLNPDDLKEKMENFNAMEIIPVPAKIDFFGSEAELLQQEGDIYFLGKFHSHSHAHLSVTSFPILYQAQFREQRSNEMLAEINSMLDGLDVETVPEEVPKQSKSSKSSTNTANKQSEILISGEDNLDLPDEISAPLREYTGNLGELLMNKVLPAMLYHKDNPGEFARSLEMVKGFLQGYRYPETAEEFFQNLESLTGEQPVATRKLELLCRKLSALHHEEFETLTEIQHELDGYGS